MKTIVTTLFAMVLLGLSSCVMALTVENDGKTEAAGLLFGIFKGDGKTCDHKSTLGPTVKLAAGENVTVPPETLPKNEPSLCISFYGTTAPKSEIPFGGTIMTDSTHIGVCTITFTPDPEPGKVGKLNSNSCQ